MRSIKYLLKWNKWSTSFIDEYYTYFYYTRTSWFFAKITICITGKTEFRPQVLIELGPTYSVYLRK